MIDTPYLLQSVSRTYNGDSREKSIKYILKIIEIPAIINKDMIIFLLLVSIDSNCIFLNTPFNRRKYNTHQTTSKK